MSSIGCDSFCKQTSTKRKINDEQVVGDIHEPEIQIPWMYYQFSDLS
jgi:hypothetical protein